MMDTYSKIVGLLDGTGVNYQEFHHEPSASSEESAAARKRAGAGDTVGAKALLVKTKKGAFHVLVIPGHSRLDSKKARSFIGKYSFATSEDMEKVTGGLQPGHMPPFGPQIFEGIASLIIDSSLQEYEKIGFNAGTPIISLVISGADYGQLLSSSSTIESIIALEN